MHRHHLHLVSDSTGETLEMIAKAALAQFEDADVIRHFWPMVRSLQHLERICADIAANPGLVLFTMASQEIRRQLEEKCRALGLPVIPALDVVVEALEDLVGQQARARPGRQHVLDAAYFARVEAIQFTIAHDDGVAWEDWEEADIVLAGVSRSSKTPTSIYLANRGFRVANIPIVVRLAQATGGRADDGAGAADPGAAQPAPVLEPGAGHRLCRQRPGGARGTVCPADVCRQWLAGDRRDAAIDRGDGGGDHQPLQRALGDPW